MFDDANIDQALLTSWMMDTSTQHGADRESNPSGSGNATREYINLDKPYPHVIDAINSHL
jgi:hypothetical protein